MVTTLYFLLFKFLLHPSEHTYFLLRTKYAVVLFSIVGIIACFLVIYIIIKSLFRKNAFLKIDQQGIFDGFSFYKNKHIKWEDIYRIESVRYNYNNYLTIFSTKSKNNEKGLSYLFYQINKITMGTPYIITSGYLECNFNEMEKAVNNAFAEYKKKSRRSN